MSLLKEDIVQRQNQPVTTINYVFKAAALAVQVLIFAERLSAIAYAPTLKNVIRQVFKLA